MQFYKNLIILEGIDGCGKGTIADNLRKYYESKDYKVLDIRKENDIARVQEIMKNYNLLLSAEPTFFEYGLKIRDFLKKADISKYENMSKLAHMFSQDRYNLYTKVLIPFLEDERNKVIQERSVISSLVYQGFEFAKLDGNIFALNCPCKVFILDVDPYEAMKRLKKRTKNDECVYETIESLSKLRDKYLSETLKKLLEKHNFELHYVENHDLKSTLETIIKKIEE